MNKQINKFLFLLLLLVFQSCKKEKINPSFNKYLDNFKLEAEKRGRDLAIDRLTISFDSRKDLGSNQCSSFGGNYDILINESIWETLSENKRERLLFHELGHCLLSLNHNNCVLEDGSSQSIMCGIGGTCLTDYCFSNYAGMRRKYYLDFLFDKSTESPSWSKLSEFEDVYKSKKRQVVDEENFDDTNGLITLSSVVAKNSEVLITSSNFLRFKFFKQFNLNQENVEIITSFKYLTFENSQINFTWKPLINGVVNYFQVGINKTEKGFFLNLNINGLSGYFVNIDDIINADTPNIIEFRKIGDMYYFFVNKKIVYIQDFILDTKGDIIHNNDGEFLIDTNNGKYSIDYVTVNSIIL